MGMVPKNYYLINIILDIQNRVVYMHSHLVEVAGLTVVGERSDCSIFRYGFDLPIL
jgi:hypothetical protein